MISQMILRQVNGMFHVDQTGRLVKSSNGEPVPDDEPVFILRGRDLAAQDALWSYYGEALRIGTPQDRLQSLREIIQKFADYVRTHKCKVPGSTHGR